MKYEIIYYFVFKGYLNDSDDNVIFYWFIASQNNSNEDPIVI
jgi:carboxypeptidase C (cathepsin A)